MGEGAGRVLVVGASGQVGGALLRVLGPRARASGRHEVDLTRPAEAAEAVAADDAEVVCIAAGMTWVDGCEDDPAQALLVNRDGPAAIAAAARARGARSVYLSTEYVFDGTAGPYAEDDAVNPLSAYGRSKWEGEVAIRDADPNALVVRTTVVWGPEAHGRNFSYQLAAKLGAGAPATVPADQVSSPTYNPDLAEAVVALVDAGATGVVHVAGAEVEGRAAFARRLAAAMGHDPGLVEPVATATLGQRAARPLDAGLRIDRARSLLPDWRPRGVEEAVADWAARGDVPWSPRRPPVGGGPAVHSRA